MTESMNSAPIAARSCIVFSESSSAGPVKAGQDRYMNSKVARQEFQPARYPHAAGAVKIQQWRPFAADVVGNVATGQSRAVFSSNAIANFTFGLARP